MSAMTIGVLVTLGCLVLAVNCQSWSSSWSGYSNGGPWKFTGVRQGNPPFGWSPSFPWTPTGMIPTWQPWNYFFQPMMNMMRGFAAPFTDAMPDSMKNLDKNLQNLQNRTTNECMATVFCQVGAGQNLGNFSDYLNEYFGMGYRGFPLANTLEYAYGFGQNFQDPRSCRDKLAACNKSDDELRMLVANL